MDRIFGTWYEDKMVDAAVKTVIFTLIFIVALLLWGALTGNPRFQLRDFFETLYVHVIAVMIVAFVAFYLAGSAHRKYRHHLTQRAHHISMRLKEKKAKARR
ncbi:MAG: hypothetical protein ABIG96_01790 [Candidatus Micrarchaeota archaeon]